MPVAGYSGGSLGVTNQNQNPYQGVLVPDPQVIAFAIDELEQSLLHVGSERLN